MNEVVSIEKSKIAVVVVAVFIALLLFYYQRPVLTSGEALLLAVEYLQKPQEGYSDSLILRKDVMDLQHEDYRSSLTFKQGFFSELLNRRQWEVTIKYEGMELTIVLDAITGEFITIYGPLN